MTTLDQEYLGSLSDRELLIAITMAFDVVRRYLPDDDKLTESDKIALRTFAAVERRSRV
jgi:hypothetical protein